VGTGVTNYELIDCGLDPAGAAALAAAANDAIDAGDPAAAWARLSRTMLRPEIPFAAHRLLYDRVFAGWTGPGPPPAWSPDEQDVADANLTGFMARRGFTRYPELYTWSVTERDAFWRAVIEDTGILLANPPDAYLAHPDTPEDPGWLEGASLNIVQSCFRAEASETAVILSNRGEIRMVSYGELQDLADRVARAFAATGLEPGDRVAIAMPMNLAAVGAFLGIIKAGGVIVGIADSFAPYEIRVRLDLTDTTTVLTSDVVERAGKTLPMYNKVVTAGAGRIIVVPSRDTPAIGLRSDDIWWDDFLDAGERIPDSGYLPAGGATRRPDDHTVILFSSGTTGTPKVLPWNHITPIKSVMDGHLHHDIRPGDVVAWPTNLGWMMGPWLIFNSLINRATMALYDDAPTDREFCRFVQDAGVTLLGVVPSLVARWRHDRCTDGVDWTRIRRFASTGESSNEDDMLWLMSRAGYRPIMDYCGGTELGGGYIIGTMIQPQSPATFSTPTLGTRIHVLDDRDRPARRGEVFLEPPAIGMSTELIGSDHHAVYYDGTPAGPEGRVLRRHGDEMESLGAGYYRALGRVDDTMNLGGIKIGSAELERPLRAVLGVADVAAVSVPSTGGGPERLVVFAVPEPGKIADVVTLRAVMQRTIREEINPLFQVDEVILTDSLPRTASNKLMRRELRARLKEDD
jgi:acetyl-CoA synthetase